MATTIFPPWPPVDLEAALPFDQAGCCGPRDICGRFKAIPLRCQVDGWSPNYDVGADWLWIKSGQLYIADETAWDWDAAILTGASPPVAALNTMLLSILQTLPNSMYLTVLEYLNVAATEFVIAGGDISESYCSGVIDLPVIDAVGPANPPEFLAVEFLPWYQPPTYPYFGT